MTAYNAGANWNPLKIRSTGVDRSNPVNSGTRTVDGGSGIGAVCPSITPCAPPSVLRDIRIGNIHQNTTPNLSDTKELKSPIGRNFTNDPIASSVSGQILGDELYDSSSCDIYSHFHMNFVADTRQPVAPQFVSQGIPTIDTLDKKYSIWIPANRIIKTTDITH